MVQVHFSFVPVYVKSNITKVRATVLLTRTVTRQVVPRVDTSD